MIVMVSRQKQRVKKMTTNLDSLRDETKSVTNQIVYLEDHLRKETRRQLQKYAEE